MRTRTNRWLGAALLVILAGSCAPAGPSADPPPTTASGAHGWTGSGLLGPVPSSGSCTYHRSLSGFYLPDPRCTPGAVDPAVTQADLGGTVCRAGGYTSSVRPPESITSAFKRQAEAAYDDPVPSSETELDHLVPLELGGSSDTRNLWPEPDQGRPGQFDRSDSFGANAKDGVEDRLHAAVCAGQVTLAAAQAAIAADWTTAERRLGLSP